jgi:hypothetical protein
MRLRDPPRPGQGTGDIRSQPVRVHPVQLTRKASSRERPGQIPARCQEPHKVHLHKRLLVRRLRSRQGPLQIREPFLKPPKLLGRKPRSPQSLHQLPTPSRPHPFDRPLISRHRIVRHQPQQPIPTPPRALAPSLPPTAAKTPHPTTLRRAPHTTPT